MFNPIKIPSFSPFLDLKYNPQIHNKPIYWMNTRLINGLILGEHEQFSRHMGTAAFPEGIVVKLSGNNTRRGPLSPTNNHKIRCIFIHFINKDERDIFKYKKVSIWKGWRFDYNLNQMTESEAPDTIQFGGQFLLSEMPEAMVYVKYIIDQVNSIH